MKKINAPFFIVLCLLATCFSCKNEGSNSVTDFFRPSIIDLDAVNEKLASLPANDASAFFNNDSVFTRNDIFKLVGNNSGIWFDKFGLNENGQALFQQIKQSHLEGLNPSDYYFEELDSLFENIEALRSENVAHAAQKMTHAYYKLSKDLLLGKVMPLEIDENWQNKNDTTWSVDSLIAHTQQTSAEQVLQDLRPQHPWYRKFKQTAQKLDELKRFRVEKSELPASVSLNDSSLAVRTLRTLLKNIADTTLRANSMVWDADAVKALEAYQSKYGLGVSGTLDSLTLQSLTQATGENIKQLGLNMERMRWLEKDFSGEFIWVNIPQAEVNYYEDDSLTFNMRAVVGRISRKTPTLDSKLSNIVFNPPWYVPPTILKQEVVPGIARRGGSYLARRGLVARDRSGRKVNPSKINASNYRRYSISQNPGRNSALGSVKFNFPNKEAIFLHDTNHRGDFGKKYRAFSSGCIRVHHPKDFARFILRDTTYSDEGIEKIIENRATKSVKVTRPVNVHIVYLTNAVDSLGNVVKVDDIYKWDEKLAAKL